MSSHIDRALFFSERSRHRDAVREYAAQLAATPDNGYVHGLMAIELAELTDFDAALHHGGEALRLEPEAGFPYFVMSQIHSKQGKLLEAADSIREAIEREPENAAYFQMLASIRAMQGLNAESLSAIKSCLALDPENVECLNLRATIEVSKGKVHEAAATARSALALDPENSISHLNQSWSFLQKGLDGKGIASIAEALRLDPDCEVSRHALRVALKLKSPTLMILVCLRLIISVCAPILLCVAAWNYIQSAKYTKTGPIVENSDQLIGALCVYFAALVIVFLKPISDCYILIYRQGRLLVSRRELSLNSCLILIAVWYWSVFAIALACSVPSWCLGGLNLLLLASIVGMPYATYEWSKSRIRSMLIMIAAPAAVFLPLVVHALGWQIRSDARGVAVYESFIAFACIVSFYYLTRAEAASA